MHDGSARGRMRPDMQARDWKVALRGWFFVSSNFMIGFLLQTARDPAIAAGDHATTGLTARQGHRYHSHTLNITQHYRYTGEKLCCEVLYHFLDEMICFLSVASHDLFSLYIALMVIHFHFILPYTSINFL